MLVPPKERLLQNFHCINLVLALKFAFEDFTEGAVTKKFKDFKRFEADSLDDTVI